MGELGNVKSGLSVLHLLYSVAWERAKPNEVQKAQAGIQPLVKVDKIQDLRSGKKKNGFKTA